MFILSNDCYFNVISFLLGEIKYKDNEVEKGSYWETLYYFLDIVEDKTEIKLLYFNDNFLLNNNFRLIKHDNKYMICELIHSNSWCNGCGRDNICRTDDCDGYLYKTKYFKISDSSYNKFIIFKKYYHKVDKIINKNNIINSIVSSGRL